MVVQQRRRSDGSGGSVGVQGGRASPMSPRADCLPVRREIWANQVVGQSDGWEIMPVRWAGRPVIRCTPLNLTSRSPIWPQAS